ncbi:hypothetical protein BDB01DRAFT_728555 [Pilobolus umbonatus]|nr:hypothetical protein BDB01DRAFT_728555 [Pilobolus umbonatus]
MLKLNNQRNPLNNYTLLLLSILVCLGEYVFAAPIEVGANGATIQFVGHQITVQGIVFSIVLFVTGAYLCFVGGVYQNFTMFIVGFYLGATVAFVVLNNVDEKLGDNSDTIMLVVCIVVGILAGGLLCCCFFLAVYILGILLGLFVASWILSWSSNGLIQTTWGRAILYICLGILGLVLMIFFERIIFVISTAFIGSFAIFLGIDVYAKTGLLELVKQMFRAKSLSMAVDATPQLRGMLGGVLGLAIVASLIQWLIIRRDKSGYRGWKERHPRGYGWKRV